MDEERLSKKIQAGVLAPMYGWNATTLPAATVGLKQSVSNLKNKGIKQVSKEMAKSLAKKKAIKAIGKIGAKMGVKHLAGLAPAATGVGAVAVPVLEGALLLDDVRDLYNFAKDDEVRDGMKYLAEDTVKGTSDFIKNNPKEAAAALIAPLPYAAYRFVKDRLNRPKVQPVATMPDGRTRYSDGSIR